MTTVRNPLRYESVEGRVVRDALSTQNLRTLVALADGRRLVDPEAADPVGEAGGVPADPTDLDVVPPLVYQTWKSHGDLPPNYAVWRRSFAVQNPGWRLLLWDDADNRAFVEREFPWLLTAYDALPSEIYRVDLTRPLFLFRYGGFYADLDTECLRPLEPLRHGHDVLLGRLGTEPGFRHSVPNAIMASTPLQRFWLYYVAVILEGLEGRSSAELLALGPEDITGPVALKRAVDGWLTDPAAAAERAEALVAQLPDEVRAQVRSGRIDVLPESAWYPFDWNNKIHARLRTRMMTSRRVLSARAARALFPRATMVTYWTAGWKRN